MGRVGVCVQIQIAAQVRPVVKRFDHRHWAAIFLESATDERKEAKCIFNSGVFPLGCERYPLSNPGTRIGLQKLSQARKSTKDDVILVRECCESAVFHTIQIPRGGRDVYERDSGLRTVQYKLGEQVEVFLGTVQWVHSRRLHQLG